MALLEKQNLETELLKIAHSAQETAEDDIHRQMLIVEKYRKAQKVAEGRLNIQSTRGAFENYGKSRRYNKRSI